MDEIKSIKERDYKYDILRSISILWIVCVLHLSNYSPEVSVILNNYMLGNFADWALAIFSLLSGLFLHKYLIGNWQDVFIFYKKRFLRFYVLFAISAITLYFTPCSFASFFQSPRQLLFSLLGISPFLEEGVPMTLWFMIMMMLFYFITPLILHFKGRSRIIFAIVAWLLLVLINRLFTLEVRVVFFAPFYLIGLILGAEKMKQICSKYTLWLVLLSVLVLVAGYFLNHNYFIIPRIAAGAILLVTAILILPDKMFSNETVKNVIYFLSYISMAMYLFHRQIYALFIELGAEATFAIPFIFLFSYLIQKSYDTLLLRIGA